MKKLYRSKENKILFGIIGGFAEYIDQDATLLRVIFVFLLIFTGFFPFGLFYFACLFVIPEEVINFKSTVSENKTDDSTQKENVIEVVEVIEVNKNEGHKG